MSKPSRSLMQTVPSGNGRIFETKKSPVQHFCWPGDDEDDWYDEDGEDDPYDLPGLVQITLNEPISNQVVVLF